MKSLYESIIDFNYNNLLIKEYNNEIIENIINESFQSKLLTNLASEIKKVESTHKLEDKQRAENFKKQGYTGNTTKTEKSFASIFGPITITRLSKQEKVQGIKWSEIKDSDFKYYNVEDDNKEVRTILKDLYKRKINADCICCEIGTKIPIIFIKGYGHELKTPGVYFFNYVYDNEGNKKAQGIKAMTRPKYSYKVRDLNFEEMMDAIDGLDIYILNITQDMLKSYNDFSDTRIKNKMGVIQYDEKSLENMLKEQKRRYKVLADEMRAKKLQEKSSTLFEDIKKANDRVVELYQKIINSPENMDEYFDLGNLMQYVSYSYESFYKSIKYDYKAKKYIEKAKERGYDNPENFAEYEKSNSQEYIRNAADYIKMINKGIEDIEKRLK